MHTYTYHKIYACTQRLPPFAKVSHNILMAKLFSYTDNDDPPSPHPHPDILKWQRWQTLLRVIRFTKYVPQHPWLMDGELPKQSAGSIFWKR